MTETPSPPALRRRPPGVRRAPVLDPAQRRVVDCPGGPLLALAGPGTGKTTTLVEAVVDRVERRGLAPEQVLVLTFSRKAAQELRERITARLGRTTRGPVALTFHGYAFALLRRELAVPGGPALRLLSGPEQDLEVARLLAGEREDGATGWPEALRPALPLRGFREELRALLLRAQERGVDGVRLAELGRQRGREDWAAAGRFLEAYEARFDLDPSVEVLDYAALVRTAAALLEGDPALREAERRARAVVLVDELQDTDPAQVRLLQALAGDGRDLVAVGDPDQSIYAFRGADVSGVLTFADAFRTAAGDPAPVVELRTCRRSGPALLAASRAVASRLPAGALGPAFRDLVAAPSAPGPGRVEVLLAPSPTAEAALVADVLRRSHLHDGVPWSDMAVLVRSTPRTLAPLRRALLGAGVPVGVPGDELPLAEEPVVRALLDLLVVALRPEAVDEPGALALLQGPLVRADALAVRRLRRALRVVDQEAGGATSTGDLLVEAVRDPRAGLLLPAPVRRPLETVQRLVRAVTTAAADGEPGGAGGTAEEVLWAAWEASRLERRLVEESLSGGARAAVADRALDTVIALFDAAARYVDRLPRSDVLGFLDDVAAHEVPGDTLAQRTPEGDAVRVLTAHASKGLEWRVVVVAGVQEGVWPDLRLRGSVLGVEELAEAASGQPDQPTDRRAALLDEERRLFYVAVTRARERLVVTAVRAGESGEDRPSRFLDELGVEVPPAVTAPGRPLTSAGLLAELRTVAATSPDPALREAACRRVALLAGAAAAPGSAAPAASAASAAAAAPGPGSVGPSGGPAALPTRRTAAAAAPVPLAHPDRWWGTAPLSDAAPLVGADERLRVSPSKVEQFDTCALRWFLESAVGVAGATGPSQVLGTLVHALAELASGPDALDLPALEARLDAVLPELDLGAPWSVVRRRQEAVEQLGKLVRWAAANPRELVGVELRVEVPLSDRAVLAGRVDRLERDDQGRAVVVDLKTTASPPARAELARHPQLGVYQLAAALGAFAEEHGLTEPGGASLLQLRNGKAAAEQVQPALADDEDPSWAAALVERVVEGMSGADFPASVNDHCRTCAVRTSCPAWPQGAGVLR